MGYFSTADALVVRDAADWVRDGNGSVEGVEVRRDSVGRDDEAAMKMAFEAWMGMLSSVCLLGGDWLYIW